MGPAIDGAIIVVYFVAIAAIGLYLGRRENSLHDFALAGRRVPWWAVMASIIAAETSAATFLGAPGEGYEKRSLAYVQLVLGVIIGRVVVGYAFLKPYYRYRVYTVYDYLAIRFGPLTRSYVSALFLVMRTLASGTRLFVPSLVMVLAWRLLVGGQAGYDQATVTGVAPYAAAIVVLAALTCVYTAAGGIKAVIWTDLIQAVLMFGSALVAIGALLHQVGGLDAVLQAVPALGRLDGYVVTGFEADRLASWQQQHGLTSMGPGDYVRLIVASDYTVFSAIIATTLTNMAAFGTDQDMAQRLLTADTQAKARRSLISAACMDLPIAAAFTFIGILLYVFYQQDPTFKPVANADVFGAYILNVLPVGVRGLVLAGVFATAMGSLSAALNALATSATNDWYIPGPGRHRTQAEHVTAARVFTVVFAALMVLIAVGFAYAKVTDPSVRIIPVVLGIAGFILGPMLGVYLVGMFTRNRGSDRGNLIAITCGLGATIVCGDLQVTLGNMVASVLHLGVSFSRPEWLPKVSFTWFAMLGALVVGAVAMCFRTPPDVRLAAEARARQAAAGDDRPLALRDD